MNLHKLKLPRMRRVLFHSSLLGTRLRREDLPGFHGKVISVLEPGGTLVVPSYTLADSLLPFDTKLSPSVGVGAYSEFVRKLPKSVRSASPLHSHSGIGPEASLLEGSSSLTSFGPGSDFEIFEEKDFWLVLFNTTFQKGATVLHHVEAICDVPYRRTISIERTIRRGSSLERVSIPYPARIHTEVATDFDRILPHLRKNSSSYAQLLAKEFGVVTVVKMREVISIASDLVKANPNFFRIR